MSAAERDWGADWARAEATPPWEDQGRDVGGPFAASDLFGRRVPRRFGIHDYLLAIARSEPERVRRIPADAYEFDGDDAFVQCPCGSRPVADGLAKCPGCERHYVLIGRSVFVAYGNMAIPHKS